MSFGNVCVYPKLSFSEVFLLQVLKSPHLVKNGCKPEPGWDKTEEERANEKAGYSFTDSQLLKSLQEFNKAFLQYKFQVCKGAVGRCVQGAAEWTLWSGVPSLHHQGPPQIHHAGHLADGDTGQVKLSQAKQQYFISFQSGSQSTSRARWQKCCWMDFMMGTPTLLSWEPGSTWWRRSILHLGSFLCCSFSSFHGWSLRCGRTSLTTGRASSQSLFRERSRWDSIDF